MVAKDLCRPRSVSTREASALPEAGAATLPALLPAPLGHPRVVAGQQHVGHAVAVPFDRTRVVRILRSALERLAERLLESAVRVAQGARQLADHGVADHHRRQLPSREHVRANRDDVRRPMLVPRLVDPLVGAAEERQVGLGRELGGEGVVELPPARCQGDHAARGRGLAVARREGRLHHVDPQDHARAAPVRGVVHLAGAQRRRRPDVDEAELEPGAQGVPHVTLLREPLKPAREEREDVDVHDLASPPASGSRSMSRKPVSTSITPAAVSTRLTASEMNGTRMAGSPTSSTSHEGPATTRLTTPSPGTSHPTRSAVRYSPSERSPPSPRMRSPRRPSPAWRSRPPLPRTIGLSSVPARRSTRAARPPTVTSVPVSRGS